MKAAGKTVLIYLICGMLWIFLSDNLLLYVFSLNAEELTRIQTFKGFFYIGITALLLYFIVNRFYQALDNKVQKLEQANEALEESEKRYSDLFRLSPLPLCVYDRDTLQFLVVNEAAVQQYGYTEEEFLSMTVKDIRPDEEVPQLMNALKREANRGHFVSQGVFKHKKKNGDIVRVEVQSNDFTYKGRDARVVLMYDVTERTKYITAIEQQNEKLHEIAHMQSHVVRAPLATMMGFVHLLEDTDIDDTDREEMLRNILVSANELDNVIREISDMTQVES